MQQQGLTSVKMKRSENPFKISTAERKILIVLCYYVFVAVFSLIAFTIATRNNTAQTRELTKYFLCEQSNPSTPCDRGSYERLAYPEITTISYVLLGLFPVVNLVYVTNFKEVIHTFKNCSSRLNFCCHKFSVSFHTSDNTGEGTSRSLNSD